jgi:hypothetical protein
LPAPGCDYTESGYRAGQAPDGSVEIIKGFTFGYDRCQFTTETACLRRLVKDQDPACLGHGADDSLPIQRLEAAQIDYLKVYPLGGQFFGCLQSSGHHDRVSQGR